MNAVSCDNLLGKLDVLLHSFLEVAFQPNYMVNFLSNNPSNNYLDPHNQAKWWLYKANQ